MKSTPTLSPWRYAKLTYGIVALCLVAYAALSLLAPAASNTRYRLSESQLLLLRLTIIIPVHFTWLLASRGAVSFKTYASAIRGGHEAPAFQLIAGGLLWTLAYLIFITLGGAILPFFIAAPYYNTLVIIRDFIPPVLALIAFLHLYIGSQRLKAIAQFTTWSRSTIWSLVFFALFAFLFVLEFSTGTNVSQSTTARNSLHLLPHWVLLFTLIIPYLTAWFLGILALINITKYARLVKGTLYRQALQNLVKGIAIVISFMVAYQVLIFAARYLTNISLGILLLIVYSLLVLYGVGFLFIRSGSKKLIHIEAVQ